MVGKHVTGKGPYVTATVVTVGIAWTGKLVVYYSYCVTYVTFCVAFVAVGMLGISCISTTGVVTVAVTGVVKGVSDFTHLTALVALLVAKIGIYVRRLSRVCTTGSVTVGIAGVVKLMLYRSCIAAILVVTGCIAIVIKNVLGTFAATSCKAKHRNCD